MKSLPERLLDQRLDGHSNSDPEIDELVALAQHLKETSQPDPGFAQQLERKIRMRGTLLQLQKRSWWGTPSWWIRTVLVALSVCVFLSIAINFVQASSPGSLLYPVKSWTQHMVGPQTNQDKNPNGQSTPRIQPMPTVTSHAQKMPGSTNNPHTTPAAIGTLVNQKGNSVQSSTIAVPATPTAAVSPSPTAVVSPTPTPTPEPIACIIGICL